MTDARTPMTEELHRLSADARVSVRRDGEPKRRGKCVLYWMQRAQRGRDNHAVDIAVQAANALGLPLVVYFAAIANYPSANLRHYVFMSQGLPDIEEDLAARNITFIMRRHPDESLERLIADVDAAILIGDENPMREPERWRRELAERARIPIWTVDADVVVPSKLIEKAQYAAYTIRPRLYRMLPEFLQPYKNPNAEIAWKRPAKFIADDVHADITAGWPELDRSVLPVEAWHGGRHAAMRRLRHFTVKLLGDYEHDRNRPEVDGTSMLSPYLHFGHIGPVTIALAIDSVVKKRPELQAARDSYFKELIVWRELAVNFVKYCTEYDNPKCAENWAALSMAEHARDEREYVYSLRQLERAETHDALWNAAQMQMLHFGWMHNHMRMYWAKKILEWTPDTATAMRNAIYLNDKYLLDGRDPNGHSGVAWSMAGKFDRPWFDRPIFGKVRYMSGVSTGKKFNSKEYVRQMRELAETAQ